MTRHQTCIPYIGRRSLNHWTTREFPYSQPCNNYLVSFMQSCPMQSHPRPSTTEFWGPPLWWLAPRFPVTSIVSKSDPTSLGQWGYHALYGLWLPTSQKIVPRQRTEEHETSPHDFLFSQGSWSCLAHRHCQKAVCLHILSSYTVIYGRGLVLC